LKDKKQETKGMIQTSYVPLEHPYRIIEYNGTLGIQIGTLIVTKDMSDRENGYAIETHSHPVVSYVNLKHIPKERTSPLWFVYNETEGVVWDKVEVNQVKTVTREGDVLPLERFMDICRGWKLKDLKDGFSVSTLWLSDSMGKLADWGVELDMPPINTNNEMTFNVELYDEIEGAKAYCLGRGDLGLAVPSIRVKDMYRLLCRQIDFYVIYFIRRYKLTGIRVIFETKDKRYEELSEMLTQKFGIGAACLLEKNNYRDALLLVTGDDSDFEEVR